MTYAGLCLFLGTMFAFTTLVLKVIEVARKQKHRGGARSGSRAPNQLSPGRWHDRGSSEVGMTLPTRSR